MDTELLKTFLEVQQTRHFGRAAENLYLTQAAVSARIKQLESALGAPVFTRYRNNLQLTETGQRLVPHAQSILIAWNRARQEVSLRGQQELILGLGASNGLWDLFLQNVLHTSYEQNPSIVLRADALPVSVLTRRLLDRTLDLTFTHESAKNTDIHSEHIADVELVLVSTDRNRHATPEALGNYIAVDWGTSFNIAFSNHFGYVPAILQTSLARIALEFLLSHQGCAYLPLTMVDSHLGTALHPITGAPTLSRPVYACYHQDCKYEKEVHSLITIARLQLDT